jgi:hypothetical protein
VFFFAKKKKKSIHMQKRAEREKIGAHAGGVEREGKNLQKQSGSRFRRSTRRTHTRARTHRNHKN